MRLALRKIRQLEAPALREYALGLLGRRALSTGEVRRKLKERALNPADIDPLIADLRERGFLNDERFAESYASARLANQGFGAQRVLRDLRQRRVAAPVAQDAVREAFAETDEVALIEAYLKRRYRGKDLPTLLAEEKNLASAFRRLRTAGFGASNSIRVLRRFSQRADELEDEPDDAPEIPPTE
ncbi:MAG: RecX family transcriptional regulator [Bryobacteraceae bacterium]|nr:RecX family transcriptional regulator [Bryobacteraceae bacterium]